MNIDFANLQYQYQLYKPQIDAAIHEVLDGSKYILGPQLVSLEEQLASLIGVKHCVSCSSGTDAILLALMALGVRAGDEVITTPFTFIATGEVIAQVGAKPVFADIDPLTYNIEVNNIEAVITPKTKAIMPVSLFGQPADIKEINALAKDHGLEVIEDAAQSLGALYQGQASAGLSRIGCTSFFPAKPLGCYGDGGALFTSDPRLAELARSLRVHGQTARYEHKHLGIGGRMDTLQAAVLLAKLPHYPEEIAKRQAVAERYTKALSQRVTTPLIRQDRESVWAQYSIRVTERDRLRQRLSQAGVPTAIHYPKPLHLQECFAYLGYAQGDFPVAERVSQQILSLPMNPFLTPKEQDYICQTILKEGDNSGPAGDR